MSKILAILATIAVFIQGKKTYALCIAAIVAAWWQYFIGVDPNVQDAIKMTEDALIGVFLRNGIATSAKG